MARSGSISAMPRRHRRCRPSSSRRRVSSPSSSCSASATGCRRWKATSIRCTPASSTAATTRRTISSRARSIIIATRIATPNMTRWNRRGARPIAPIARPGRTTLIIASATSCCPSGRWRRRSRSTSSAPAPGCRWMTIIRCWWSSRSRCRCGIRAARTAARSGARPST